MSKISLYNRETKSIEEEFVFEKQFMDFFYSNKFGLFLSDLILKRPFISKMLGMRENLSSSKKRIKPFIEKYKINTNEILEPLESFKTFNEFFTRKLKVSAREVKMGQNILISPSDARLLAYKIDKNTVIPVKGLKFTLDELIGDDSIINTYNKGTCLVFRLAPVDYHRFIYIDNGTHDEIKSIGKYFHSVNPLALKNNFSVFQKNYREICILKTANFGDVIHIDVGALGVGKIIQNHREKASFLKGEEKGYFEFGASTIVLIFKPSTVKIDKDIIEFSKKGIETIVKCGSSIGEKRV